jgi:hypothetical protein
MEVLFLDQLTDKLIALFDAANIYWAFGIFFANVMFMSFIPTRLKGNKWYHKGYNFVVGSVLNKVAGNFLKARNADDVVAKKEDEDA